jgi:hypothetical protein
VAWDNDATPTIICAYLSVDSIVGQRLFFGQGTGGAGNATLVIPTAACTTAGANKIAYVWDTATTGLPLAVWNALQGGNSVNPDCSGSTTSAPVHFNVAFTDVRPEDALFLGNNRVLCNDAAANPFFPTDTKNCLGYGPGVLAPGTAIVSSYSTSSAQAVAYNFVAGQTDPISLVAIPASTTFAVGAEAIIPFVNTTDQATAGGFGLLTNPGVNPRLTNISRESFAAIYTGRAILTRDVLGVAPGSIPAVAVHALQREPMSGTYTTTEWQLVRRADGSNDFSQETGILGASQAGFTQACFVQNANAFPAVACSNPVSTCVGATCGLRTRVIGTGQMVSTANNSAFMSSSILAYAFWSLGSFGGKANIKYLTLDGVDGLVSSYATNDGHFPGVVTTVGMAQGVNPIVAAPVAGQCAGYFNGDGVSISKFSCNAYTLPTFDGIQSGNYRAWNILRGTYYGAVQTANFSPLNIAGFVLGAQDQAAPTNPVASRIPDFLPTSFCGNMACSSQNHPVNVFRSHYAIPSWGIGIQNNGVQAGTAENGGDVAGAVFNTQTEVDNGSIFGDTFLTYIQ